MPQDYAFDSRVIYKSLTRMTDDFALLQVSFRFWKDNHADVELDPIKFAEALKQHVGIDDQQRRALIVAAFATQGQSIDALPPVPAAIEQSQSAVASQAKTGAAVTKPGEFSKPNSAQWVIITNFMKLMFAQVKKQAASQDFKEELLDGPGDLDEALYPPLQAWASSDFSSLALNSNISEAACTDYAHNLYLALCNTLGPPKADQILDAVIRELSNYPEAQSFNPKNLL